ncbi:hypothetical protein CO614_05565 [Lysobacteraceae bacterium NML120232]|nr:hypothetical protein CO614_05565 [Xanthomonadaceae bacterium NML120232]
MSSVAVRNKSVLALLAALWLGACTAEPQAGAPPPPQGAQEAAETTVSAEVNAETATPATETGVDAQSLPQDVQDFILNQRMCRHFNRPVGEGGNSTMAGITCPKADDAAWKALLRKYQSDETIGSVLLAERPAESKIEE